MASQKKYSPADIARIKEENEKKVEIAMKKIQEGVKNVFSSDNFKNYLKFMSKFHNYSLNNSMLIMLQKPEASLVAGFNKWKTDFNRHVNAGEKGISILAPCPYKNKKMIDKTDEFGDVIIDPKTGKPEQEEQHVSALYFKVVTVFDISQTTGDPVPELISELKGSNDNAKELFSAIREVSDCSFAIVSEKDDDTLRKGAKGYYNKLTNMIVIKEELSDIHKVKTALHEYAHSQFHNVNEEDKSREQKEIEAESTAFVLSEHFGIDTSDYSFPYVATWGQGKNDDELKDILQNITSRVSKLIEKIEPVYQKRLELNKEKEQNLDIER